MPGRNMSYRLLAILFLLATAPLARAGQSGVVWGYSGDFPPETWAQVSSDFAACRDGMQQSPIDITNATPTTLIPMEIDWHMPDWEVENIGPTAILRATGAGVTMIDDNPYTLVQIALHAPSEHTIDGQRYPMEMQFLHIGPEGDVAAIALMMRSGGRNEMVDRLFAAIPTTPGAVGVATGVNLTELLTDTTDVFRYRGSLTMPPCFENVTWTILKDPLRISDAALLGFRSVFDDNARPLQPKNRRYILTD